MTPTAGHRITITTRLVASAISQIGEYRHRVTCGCGWCSVETDDVFQANAWRNRGCPTRLHAGALAEFAQVRIGNPTYQLTRDDVAQLPTETLVRILGDEVRPMIAWAQAIIKDELHARAHLDNMDAVHARALAECTADCPWCP